jgi:hypothetical protein
MKNKITLVALIVCTYLTTFAHPKDTDKLDSIGEGTILQLIQDINLPANTRQIEFRLRDEKNFNTCTIYAESEKNYDRRIKSKIDLKIVRNTRTISKLMGDSIVTQDLLLSFPSSSGGDSYINLLCNAWEVYYLKESNRDSMYLRNKITDMTIGQFKDLFKNQFRVILPEPKDF